MKDDRLYLIHIFECMERIEAYTQEGKSEFFHQTIVQDAVLRNLQIMTESTQHFSASFKVRHPELDWKAMAGLRNILVHNYLGIKLERV